MAEESLTEDAGDACAKGGPLFTVVIAVVFIIVFAVMALVVSKVPEDNIGAILLATGVLIASTTIIWTLFMKVFLKVYRKR